MAPKRKSDANATTAAPAKKTKTASTDAPAAEDAQKVSKAPKSKPATAKKASKAATTPAESPAASAAPRFSGKFDLYSTKLPFLHREYLPAGADAPDFAAVHSKILFYQAKPDFSIRIAIADGGAGRFACSQVANPMSGEELEPIIMKGREAKNVEFDEDEAAHYSTAGSGLGYTGKLTLDSDGEGCGLVKGGKGAFKMRRVWEEDGKELFEGYWDLRVTYGPMMRRKGFGSGDTFEGAFWAVRALKDADGKEIGIDV